MGKFQVWSEGYQATGQKSEAQFHGEFEGESFKEAVSNFRDSLEDEYSKSTIDLDRLTFWGCRFFDNEEEAKRSFG